MSRCYGPHREEDTPTTIPLLWGSGFPQEIQFPYPEALAEQRRQINTRAWRDGQRTQSCP